MACVGGLLLRLVIASLPEGPGPCSLDGVWNADGVDKPNPKLVQISQPAGANNLTVAWWLPHPTTKVTASLNVETHELIMSNGFKAVANFSDFPPGEDRDCTRLEFSDPNDAVWCLQGYCPPSPAPPGPHPPPPPTTPPPPTPYDPETNMPRFEVPSAQGDGALYPGGDPAYFFMSYTGSPGYIIHLSGGGWRFAPSSPSNKSHDEVAWTSDGLGESGHCYGKCDGILSNDPKINPLFHSWNKIWIPISGTSFTGDRWDTKIGFVRGKRIQTAVIAELLANHSMSNASNVILTGGSSGGLATYLTCDRVGAQIKSANSSTRYTCLADAGYFLHHNDINGGNSTSENFKNSYYGWNSSSGTNQDCVAALKPSGEDWKCIFAQYVVPYIKSELFVMQNLYDSWQINNILKIGCSGYNQPMTGCTAAEMQALESYGADMRTALSPLVQNPGVGMFAPSCIAHCQSVMNEHDIALWYWPGRWSIVEGQMSLYPRDVFGAWYTGNVTGAASKHVQQCEWSPETCNKLCPDWT